MKLLLSIFWLSLLPLCILGRPQWRPWPSWPQWRWIDLDWDPDFGETELLPGSSRPNGGGDIVRGGSSSSMAANLLKIHEICSNISTTITDPPVSRQSKAGVAGTATTLLDIPLTGRVSSELLML